LNVASSENPASDRQPSKVLTIEDLGDGVVRLIGEVDMATAPTLQRYLEIVPTATVLDLRDVTFIDSSGLSVLVRAHRDRPKTEPLTLRSPTSAVCRVLEITGLIDVFRIDPGPAPN
jgi:stage II sporulation protein AA (anti-sigma F factor antagonist)